jgi:hypothetical protein
LREIINEAMIDAMTYTIMTEDHGRTCLNCLDGNPTPCLESDKLSMDREDSVNAAIYGLEELMRRYR